MGYERSDGSSASPWANAFTGLSDIDAPGTMKISFDPSAELTRPATKPNAVVIPSSMRPPHLLHVVVIGFSTLLPLAHSIEGCPPFSSQSGHADILPFQCGEGNARPVHHNKSKEEG